MDTALSKKQVHEWMSLLTDGQREFLERTETQSKKSKWLEVLAKSKGLFHSDEMTSDELEELVDDWILLEVKDCGFGNRDFHCICGMSLRYQYVVLNRKEGKTLGLGEKCFENHTNLSPTVVKDILKEFHRIDLTRDEILFKLAHRDFFNMSPYVDVEGIPPEIIEQASIGLPLTEKQITTVLQLEQKDRRKRRNQRIMNSLSVQSKELLNGFSPAIQDELIRKIEDNDYEFRTLPDGFQDDEIEKFLACGLPLLDKHVNKIFAFNRKNRQRILDERRKEESDWAESSYDDQTKQYGLYDQDTSEESISYDLLINRHLGLLQQIRAKEQELHAGMTQDWNKIQDIVRQAKRGEPIDYQSFKLNLQMICYCLKIEANLY